MKKFLIALAFATVGTVALNAQTTTIEAPTLSKYSVATNSFWSNWFIQAGVDMSLANPHGVNFMDDVFPNGKSFGVDLAVGKQFTPGLGLRLKLNWENGQIENKHNTWTPDYDAGGYAGLYGDVMFNLSNMLCGYSATRTWNFIPFMRGGVIRNFGLNYYAPAVGAGIENTWRFGQHFGIYLDAAYTWTTHVFGRNTPYYWTNNRHGAEWGHGIVSVDLGVQFYLGKATFDQAVRLEDYNALAAASEAALARLRAELDAEKRLNADLQAQLAKWKNHVCPKGDATTIIGNAASSIFFNLNSSKINNKKDLINLEAIATAAKNCGGKVVITGSADSKTGSATINQKLAEARANAVANELVNLGVSRDKIETKALGGVADVTPYPLNRRAVVEIK